MWMPKSRTAQYASIFIVAIIVYANTYNHGFVFDDASAIKSNRDLRPETSLAELFSHDFWGVSMQETHSHKSYRPLTVLTFKLNYALFELNASAYHISNIVLHAVVCVLLAWTLECAFRCHQRVAYLSALLFAVHPVHTEAVAGVVGRAELLSAAFFLLSLSTYSSCTYQRFGLYLPAKFRLFEAIKLIGVGILVSIGSLCKEQCITVIGMCVVLDLLYELDGFLVSIFARQPFEQRNWRLLQYAAIRWSVLVTWGLAFIFVRIHVIQAGQMPYFRPFDNPASTWPTPVRQLTYNYLLVENFWLMVCPSRLMCDWAMGTVPLVLDWSDVRNLATLLFWLVSIAMVLVPVRSLLVTMVTESVVPRQILAAIACIVLPFLPAANLFLPVGFVVAERVLYIPSIGFCLLVAIGYDLATSCRLASRSAMIKNLHQLFIYSLLATFAAKTIVRNSDWFDDRALFTSGIKVNYRNAKLWNNMGHVFEGLLEPQSALPYFQHAKAVQPDDRGAWQNVARTLVALNQTEAAEQAYRHAIGLLPQPRPEVNYTTHVSAGDLSAYSGLAQLLIKANRSEEAESLLRDALLMKSDYVPVLVVLAQLHVRSRRLNEAAASYRAALQSEPFNADIIYNLGIVEASKPDRDPYLALQLFDDAIRENPDHRQALFHSARVIQESRLADRFPEARRKLQRLIAANSSYSDAWLQLAMLDAQEKRHDSAEINFQRVLELAPDDREALLNLAVLYAEQLSRPIDAIRLLEHLLSLHPTDVDALLLLGQINVNYYHNLDTATKVIEMVLRLDPNNVVAMHHKCVVTVERGALQEGLQCLERAKKMAPHLNNIDIHIQIVRDRINNLRH